MQLWKWPSVQAFLCQSIWKEMGLWKKDCTIEFWLQKQTTVFSWIIGSHEFQVGCSNQSMMIHITNRPLMVFTLLGKSMNSWTHFSISISKTVVHVLQDGLPLEKTTEQELPSLIYTPQETMGLEIGVGSSKVVYYLCELRLWSTFLKIATVQEWKKQMVDDRHENLGELEGYWSLYTTEKRNTDDNMEMDKSHHGRHLSLVGHPLTTFSVTIPLRPVIPEVDCKGYLLSNEIETDGKSKCKLVLQLKRMCCEKIEQQNLIVLILNVRKDDLDITYYHFRACLKAWLQQMEACDTLLIISGSEKEWKSIMKPISMTSEAKVTVPVPYSITVYKSM